MGGGSILTWLAPETSVGIPPWTHRVGFMLSRHLTPLGGGPTPSDVVLSGNEGGGGTEMGPDPEQRPRQLDPL